ncbi:MAG TPA: alpha/beta fold hydrolase [Solirubrobacteraceae bacterium]|jgi:pimeloyl-ACP methyl ester carboxylesterase
MSTPLGYELRFWPEFARLLAEVRFWTPEHGEPRRPVLLIPGFLAGDASLTVLAGWLRRRGHEVRHSGIRLNVGCAGRELDRLGTVLEAFDEPAIVIGQSRGGTLARALAARHPDEIAAMMTLGSPVLDQLAVSPSVLRTVRSVALLGDLGVRGLLTNECRDGACCSEFRTLLAQPLGPEPPWVAVYSRSDAIVDWRACLDPAADCVEVDGSHCGMAVNVQVYRELERLLERSEEITCSR